MEQGITEDRLISYLLGELSEEEQIQLEGMFFTDESGFEHLLVIEEELINDYLSGELSKDRRKRFEKYFLSTPERIERMQFNKELLASISRVEGPQKTAKAHSGSALGAWFMSLRIGKYALLTAFATTMALLLLGSLRLYFDRTHLRTQVGEMQAQLESLDEQRQALDQQVAQQHARSRELSEQLQRNQDERKRLEQELALAQQRHDSIVSLVLAPAGGRTPKSAKLGLPASPRLLRLKLRLDAEARHKSYRLVLQKEGSEILTINGLHAGSNNSAKVINLILPSSAFTEGGYVLTLYGGNDSGKFEEVSVYSLNVLKN